MAYIGKQPTKAPLTASDIEDGIITAAKIEDGAVVAAEIASNAVTTAKINADAVTGAKIADDAIDSEHYTDASIDTAHITDANVTSAKIAADAITAAKIADDAISDEHLDPTAITGQTAETSAADDDLILLSDTSASAALRKMTRTNFLSGVGGANTPQFSAYLGSNQSIANNTITKVAFNTEKFDPQSTYDNSTNYRFTPAVAGNYFIYASVRFTNDSTYIPDLLVYVNGSNIHWVSGTKAASAQYINVTIGTAITLDDDDYVEIFCRQDSGGAVNIHGVSDTSTIFHGFKLI